MNRDLGLIIVLAGVAVIVVGGLVWAGAFSWFGRLPGDIRIETDDSRIYVPIVSGLVVSVALTVIVNVVARILR